MTFVTIFRRILAALDEVTCLVKHIERFPDLFQGLSRDLISQQLVQLSQFVGQFNVEFDVSLRRVIHESLKGLQPALEFIILYRE